MLRGDKYTIRNNDLQGKPIIEGQAILCEPLRVIDNGAAERWTVQFPEDDPGFVVERIIYPGDEVDETA